MIASVQTTEAIVSETIGRESLLDPSDRVLVAFSGGPDSCALAIVLKDLGFDVVLGHVDHGMHALAREHAGRAMEIARSLELELHTAIVSVEPPTEAEARARRYEALEGMADQLGATKIATGHTLDDQAETVLMRLGRGGHAIGIPLKRGRIVRPLLDIRRSDTESVCRASGIDFLDDPTNLDVRFSRNLIRHRVFPSFPDEVVVALAHMGDRSRGMIEEADLAVKEAWHSSVTADEERIAVRRDAIGAGGGIASQLIRAVLLELGIEATSQLVADIREKVAGTTGAMLHLPGGLAVWSESDRVVFGKVIERSYPEVSIELVGTTRLDEWGIEVIGEEEAPGPLNTSKLIAVFDFDRLGQTATIRSRRPGDRFRPLGMSDNKKLQDFFVDRKVPRMERDSVPLMVAGDEIAWVIGHRIAEVFKVSGDTRRAIKMEVKPL